MKKEENSITPFSIKNRNIVEVNLNKKAKAD